MSKDFDALFAWKNNSLTIALTNNLVALRPTTLSSFTGLSAVSSVLKAVSVSQTVGFTTAMKTLTATGALTKSVANLATLNTVAPSISTIASSLKLPQTVVPQFESTLERMGGWDKITRSVTRHFSTEHNNREVQGEHEMELEEAVVYVKKKLTLGNSLESIANQASSESFAPQKEYTKGILIGLIVFYLSMLSIFLWNYVQKMIASRPAIHYAGQHDTQIAMVTNKTGVNVRETSEEDSFSVHSFDEGVYVLLMPGRTKNRREVAYLYDDDNNPIKTGWVPPGALRIIKKEQQKSLLADFP